MINDRIYFAGVVGGVSAYSYIPKESVSMVTVHAEPDDSFYARAAQVHNELAQQEAHEAFLKEHVIKMEKADPRRSQQKPPTKKNVNEYQERAEYEEPLPSMITDEHHSQDGDKETMQYSMGYEEGEQIVTVMPSDAVYPDEASENRTPQLMETKEEKDRSETFNCTQCSKVFISLASLEAHKKHAHSFIMCDICGRPFSQKANLLKHKLIHANKKPFACRVCNKAFRQKANLQRHELIHDKDRKTVNCTECNKSFRCAWSLKQHMKNHQGGAGGAFGCSICGKTFKDKTRLMQHFAVHNQMGGLTCHICNIKLESPEVLSKHLETHHGNYHVATEGDMAVKNEGQPIAWLSTSGGGGEPTVLVANHLPEDDVMVGEYNRTSPTPRDNVAYHHHMRTTPPHHHTNGSSEMEVKTLNGEQHNVSYGSPHQQLPIHFEDGTIVAVQHGEPIPIVASSMGGGLIGSSSMGGLVVMANATS